MQQWFMRTGLISSGSVYCIAYVGKKLLKFRNFYQIFAFWGLLCPSPFTNLSQIWQQTVDPQFTLTGQISFESIYCVTFKGQKTHSLGQILTFGAPVSTPFTDKGQI